MITAVDTNVLLDILTNSPRFAERSLSALNAADAAGVLVISEIVFAELSAAFDGDADRHNGFLTDAGIRLVRSSPAALQQAGAQWRTYRRRGGPRKRILPDFLIGAHASQHTDQLLTRDRGFFKKYFQELTLLEP